MKYIFVVFFLLLTIITSYGQGWFDYQSIESTVLLEKKVDGKYQPHGTGFLLYNYDHSKQFTLVTCEHILRNKSIFVTIKANQELINHLTEINDSILPHFNNIWKLEGNVLRTEITLIENKTFTKHTSLDIAAFPLDISSKFYYLLKNDTLEIQVCNVKSTTDSGIKRRNEIKLGEDVYFLGFPFMIGTSFGMTLPSNIGSIISHDYTDEVSNPLLRSGIISWISDEKDEFLVDAFSYGGNSGSPVFTKNLMTTKKPYLIGMVIGHLGEEVEVEIDNKTNKPKSTLKGNSGLVRCLWFDDILEIVERARNL